MSENQKQVRRGRPPVLLVFPRFCEVTITDIMERNNICRLTAYNHLKKLVKGADSELIRTRLTRPTGGVGKPGKIFLRRSLVTPEIMADIAKREIEAAGERRKRSAIKAAKSRKQATQKHQAAKARKQSRKLAKVPAIVMTAPEPVADSAPAPAPEAPVTTPEPAPVETAPVTEPVAA